MQEEVNEKTISFVIKGGRISADILKATLRVFVRSTERMRYRAIQNGRMEQATDQEGKITHGKQSLKKMMEDGSQLTNIEITDNNIKSFERVARKYAIDYGLKKDRSTDPPRYLVFFRAKDVDVMTAAFKEYTGLTMEKQKRVSIRKKLALAKERVAKNREREKTRQKDRGQAL